MDQPIDEGPHLGPVRRRALFVDLYQTVRLVRSVAGSQTVVAAAGVDDSWIAYECLAVGYS